MTDEIPLRQYIEELLLRERSITEEKFLAIHTAIEKATIALNYRLESMNEFRAQITSERQTYFRVEAFEAFKAQNIRDIDQLRSALRVVEDYRVSMVAQQIRTVAIMSAIWTVITFLITKFVR